MKTFVESSSLTAVLALMLLGGLTEAAAQGSESRNSEAIKIVSPADGGVQVRWHDSVGAVEMWTYGDVETSPDCSEILSVPVDGYLILEDTRVGRVKRLEVTADSSSALVTVYTIDGIREGAPEEQWLRESLMLLRQLKVASPQRGEAEWSCTGASKKTR